jgi:hypothetical protein
MRNRNRNERGGKRIIAVLVGLFVLGGLIGLLPASSAAPGLIPDMRGSWQGRLVPDGLPVATPVGITMTVTSQGIGNFSGTFTGPDYVTGTLSGTVTTGGSVSFTGDAPDVDLSNGRARFMDYGGGAAILDGTVNVTSSYPFYAGPREMLEIRPFTNVGGCPCTPAVGDYIGTWGDGGSGGAIKFTVQAPNHATPTKFTSYLYITVGGQQHGGGLIGTGDGDGNIVAIAHANTGRVILTADLTQLPFQQPRINGSFTFEINEGAVISERFSVVKQ